MARCISYDSHHGHQFQPEILHMYFIPNETFQRTGSPIREQFPPEKNEKLIWNEQPQLLMMDYGFSFRRKAVTGMCDWVSNSLLRFGAVLKRAFKTAQRLRCAVCGWKTKRWFQAVVHLTGNCGAQSRLLLVKEHLEIGRIWPKREETEMSTIDVVREKTWPVDEVVKVDNIRRISKK